MRHMTLITASVLTVAFFLTGILYAQGQTETVQTEPQKARGLDNLLDDLKERREVKAIAASRPMDRDGQLLRLQSELIDLRVERDRLVMQVNRLETRLQGVTVFGASSKCRADECVPLQQVELEKMLLQASHAIDKYKCGKRLYDLTPSEEVKKYAETMMRVALDDLELLGFDTTDLLENEDFADLLSQKRELTEKASQR